MTEKEMDKIIEQVRKLSGKLSTQLEERLEENSNTYLHTIQNVKEKLLAGKILIEETGGIEEILDKCSDEEKNIILKKLVSEITSHDTTILKYRAIFGIKDFDASLPQNILYKLERIKKIVTYSKDPNLKRNVGEVYKEIQRVSKYKAPYKVSEGEKVGYFEKPTDKEPKWLEVGEEERKIARQYIKNEGEFICNFTMQKALMKLAKGEITAEDVEKTKMQNERQQKEAELRSYIEEEAELDETLAKAEQLEQIQENGNKTQ